MLVFCLLNPKESGFVIIVVTIITRPFMWLMWMAITMELKKSHFTMC